MVEDYRDWDSWAHMWKSRDKPIIIGGKRDHAEPEEFGKGGMPMQRKDRRFFERILLVQSPSRDCAPMVDLLRTIAREEGYEFTEDRGNAYMVKRTSDELPIGLVAHTDTVHKRAKDFSVVGNDDWITGWDNSTGRQHGVGGDDRCGIFMALMVARQIPNARLFFPRDEEIGCVGSSLMLDGWLDDCAFIMQADRRGWGDVTKTINYMPVMSKKFERAVKKLMDPRGMRFVDGMTTDIEVIKEGGAKVSAFNMSASYYYPHYDTESIYIPGVQAGIEFMLECATVLGKKRWMHTSPQTQWGTWGRSAGLQDCLNCGTPTLDSLQICFRCADGLDYKDKKQWSDNLKQYDGTNELDAIRSCDECKTFGPVYHVGEGINLCADCVVLWYERETQEPDCEWGTCDGCGTRQTVYPAGEAGLWCASCIGIIESLRTTQESEQLVEEVR